MASMLEIGPQGGAPDDTLFEFDDDALIVELDTANIDLDSVLEDDIDLTALCRAIDVVDERDTEAQETATQDAPPAAQDATQDAPPSVDNFAAKIPVFAYIKSESGKRCVTPGPVNSFPYTGPSINLGFGKQHAHNKYRVHMRPQPELRERDSSVLHFALHRLRDVYATVPGFDVTQSMLETCAVCTMQGRAECDHKQVDRRGMVFQVGAPGFGSIAFAMWRPDRPRAHVSTRSDVGHVILVHITDAERPHMVAPAWHDPVRTVVWKGMPGLLSFDVRGFDSASSSPRVPCTFNTRRLASADQIRNMWSTSLVVEAASALQVYVIATLATIGGSLTHEDPSKNVLSISIQATAGENLIRTNACSRSITEIVLPVTASFIAEKAAQFQRTKEYRAKRKHSTEDDNETDDDDARGQRMRVESV